MQEEKPPFVDRAWAIRWLLAIMIVAAFLRFWGLGTNPPGLFRDEAEKGYTALELWTTGRQGQFMPDGTIQITRVLPLFVDAGGVKTSAIYQYLSAPIVGLFGLNVWTTRAAAALVGTLTVLVVFFLARVLIADTPMHGRTRAGTDDEETRRTLIPLSAVALLAISPTHVLFSRWAQQGITLPLLVALGAFCLLKVSTAEPRHRRALGIGGGALLGIAAYAYDPARLVLPFIALGIVWEHLARRGAWRDMIPGAVAFAVIEIPLILFTLTEGSARLQRVTVLNEADTNPIVAVFLNYLAHFNPQFLFITGDANPRHSMPLSGLLPWAETPLSIIGLAALIWKRPPGARLLAVWLLAAPLAASLTNDGIPHALRSILFLPVIHLVSASGLVLLTQWFGRRTTVSCIGASCAITTTLLIIALFTIMPRQGAPWQYGVLQAMAAMDERNPEGPNALSVQIPYAHYYVLFHDQPHPRDFHERGLDAARTLILPPGGHLPDAALVARPPSSPFERFQTGDIQSLEGQPGDPPAMAIRNAW